MKFRKFTAAAGWVLALILSAVLLFGCSAKPAVTEVQTTAAFEVTEPTREAETKPVVFTEPVESTEAVIASAESTEAVIESETAEETEKATEAVTEATQTTVAAELTMSTEAVDAMPEITENGIYTGKNEVAFYLHTYGHLPSNYITKKKAEAAGWVSTKGNLQEVCPGMSIGGSGFGNFEGLLPDKKGRKYYECDIDYAGGKRNAKRIIYSNDGLIFYTGDHYKTFEQLY